MYLFVAIIFLSFRWTHSTVTLCPRYEEFDICGKSCEPTCKKPQPELCTPLCIAGCRCMKGYFRSDDGECVLSCKGKFTESLLL
ncbi:hypothetical protein Q1695_003836 [Nippostrongylus brasiliensis]|nr:hypothetical protein Q1695_003836 [Nippostrongylus brasiliensis]